MVRGEGQPICSGVSVFAILLYGQGGGTANMQWCIRIRYTLVRLGGRGSQYAVVYPISLVHLHLGTFRTTLKQYTVLSISMLGKKTSKGQRMVRAIFIFLGCWLGIFLPLLRPPGDSEWITRVGQVVWFDISDSALSSLYTSNYRYLLGSMR